IMELKTLRALTLKHINLSINMLNNPGLFNTSDSSFNILIEEQIFITLAFVGSFLERSNKNIYKDKTLLGYKYLWNYSKHGETPFKFVALDVKPSFTFPLVITKKFIFGKSYCVWDEMPFDDDPRNKKQFAAYQETLQGKNMKNSLQELLTIIEQLNEI
ncbi:TPA: hypothetical protein IUX50_001520, partial [Enterococcus faecalis]|nr:hypothetical protein [Enterococcus faecalis]